MVKIKKIVKILHVSRSSSMSDRKRSLDVMAGFSVVESAHPGSSSRFGMGVCIYLDLFQDYSCAILSLVDNLAVNSETPEVLIGVGCAYTRS
jgi:hypothetical protein